MSGRLSELLRGAVASGDFGPLGEALADDAVLDTSSQAGRRLIRGPEAIVAHLEGPGPGEVAEWEAGEWDRGAAITFEWRGGGGPDRRRWYVRADGGRVTGIWSYAARSRLARDPVDQLPPEVLRRLGDGARRAPLAHGGNSGAALERIELEGGGALVAKRVGEGSDWLGRATADRGRTALLWESGAFARLPDTLDPGLVGVEPEPGGRGWWVLMRDLSAELLPAGRRLSAAESRRVLDAAADMYRAFAGERLDGPAMLEARLGATSPAVSEREREGPDLPPKQFEAAWDAFAEAADDDVAAEVLAAVADPSALAAALLDAGPVTLIHGDLRDDNLGVPEGRVVLIDWDLATIGTPTVDFGWYLLQDAWRIDAGRDRIEADHREALGDLLVEREVELGMLSGLVQYGWLVGHSALVHPDPVERDWALDELAWWMPRARLALERVGGMPR